MIKITVVGRLGADAEVRHTQGGTSILSFRLAADSGFGDNKQTEWFGCSIFGKRAEGRLSEFLTKGTQVVVVGSFSTREYKDKVYNEVNVDEITLVGGSGSGQKETSRAPSGRPSQSRAEHVQEILEDEIPF